MCAKFDRQDGDGCRGVQWELHVSCSEWRLPCPVPQSPTPRLRKVLLSQRAMCARVSAGACARLADRSVCVSRWSVYMFGILQCREVIYCVCVARCMCAKFDRQDGDGCRGVQWELHVSCSEWRLPCPVPQSPTPRLRKVLLSQRAMCARVSAGACARLADRSVCVSRWSDDACKELRRGRLIVDDLGHHNMRLSSGRSVVRAASNCYTHVALRRELRIV
ncbi:hypothetical protein J6590_030305 [Homalodisca vitripennis]|nr:hypothetical protein J6590_030305 [Homalodisca vitripennis]